MCDIMAKKKSQSNPTPVDEIPKGEKDEDGDEVIDLYAEEDNLDDDEEIDLNEIEDEMLAEETEEEEFGYEISEVEKMMRKIKCEKCPGNSSKVSCKVRDDFGCPPDKADK